MAAEARSEAKIHFELFHHLQTSVDDKPRHGKTRYSSVEPEMSVNGGRADIVLTTGDDRPLLVIEAKREGGGQTTRDIDPYSPKVIQQAFGYAGSLGAPYFATYNGNFLVLFKTFERGKHLLDRKSLSFEIDDVSRFARTLLSRLAALEEDRITWDPHHRAFVNRHRTFHSRLSKEALHQ